MALTTGTVKVCEALAGGGKTLWLVDVGDISSMTLTGTAYSAITMSGGAVFKAYQFSTDSFELKESTARENKSHKVTHSIEFYIDKMNQLNRDAVAEIMESSNCGVVAIVEDSNLTKWVVGWNENFDGERPLELITGEGGSGKLIGDLNGTVVTLQSEDNELMRTYTGSVPL